MEDPLDADREAAVKELRDTHKGETCLVVGNGPSLKKIPKDFLKKYPTFGTNRC